MISDVVGIELCSGNPAGCPAVRLQRKKGVLGVTAVGFVPNPAGSLPMSWDDLSNQPKWSVPSPFRAECAALAINSSGSLTRQMTADPLQSDKTATPEGIAASKDGTRFVYRKMPDSNYVLKASLPEYQALWLSRLIPAGRRPAVVSLQTAPSTLLCSLSAQPDFCKEGDEMAIFVTQSKISIAAFRQGIPLLFRDCPGAAGVAAMREALKTNTKLDDSMLETLFSNSSLIDMRYVLNPLLSSVVPQIEFSLVYLQNRLGATPRRIFLMGDAIGCQAVKQCIGEQQKIPPIVMPNPFDGLEMPSKHARWKDKFCKDDASPVFLSALGAALAVLLEDAQ